MPPLIRRLAFGLYILIAVCVFGYVLFPAEPIKGFVENRMAALLPEYRVTIQSLKPRLPGALKMSGVGLYRRNSHLVEMTGLKIKPTLGSLFSSTKSYKFEGRLHHGTLQGTIHVQSNSQPSAFSLSSELQSIDLTTVPGLERWREQVTSGNLEGRIRYDQHSTRPTLGAQLTFTDLALKLDIPVEKLGLLRFANITADLQADGAQMQLRQCRFSGPQGEGQITGTIQLRDPVSESDLNLSGQFKPNPELIMQLQGTIWGQMLTAGNPQSQGGYPFRIQGRANAPQWQLR